MDKSDVLEFTIQIRIKQDNNNMNKIKTLEINDLGVPSKLQVTIGDQEPRVINKVNSTYFYADKKMNSYSEWFSLNGNTYV